ncbi:MAG: SDR family oxidoreductase [Janthinobacterium lividum]
MNILVCGASGFIGHAICASLERDGHRVLKGVRHATQEHDIAIDYSRDVEPGAWQARLQDVDVVVNAVGILIEQGDQRFEAVHQRTPIALFDASVRAGVKLIVQVSALGAQTGDTRYFASKRTADTHLQSLPVNYQILRPAMVYGPTGASARMFRVLASLPVHLLPAGGHQAMRPVHVDQFAEIVTRSVDALNVESRVIDVVGGTQLSYREMLAMYRNSMGLPAALQIGIPAVVIDASAALLDRVPGSMLTRDTWKMLQAGSTADVAPTTRALGRVPTGVETFIDPADAAAMRAEALSAWLPLVLRVALAVTWFWAAIATLFVTFRASGLAQFASMPGHGSTNPPLLYLAAAIDVIFGVATLARPGRRLWLIQAFAVLAYSILLAVVSPSLLLDPFGSILKNLPMLAVLAVLFSGETKA